MTTLQQATEALTPEIAYEWLNTTDKYIYVIDFLDGVGYGVSAHQANADSIVDFVEGCIEAILVREENKDLEGGELLDENNY